MPHLSIPVFAFVMKLYTISYTALWREFMVWYAG